MRRPGLALCMLLLLQLAGCSAFKRCAYEDFGRRDGWQQPDRVVETLALTPGDRVADLGAGGGYFSFRLAEAVGAEGIVYAVEVDPAMLEHLAEEANRRDLPQLRPLMADADDPGLPDGEIDWIFTVNTYHHLSDRVAYFRTARADLAPGGRVAILDFDGPGFLRSHYSEKQDILREMREAGYRLVADHDFIDRQSFLVFESCGAGPC